MERKKRRTFTREYKAEIVRVIRTSGKSPELVAREYELTPSAVRAWVERAAIDARKDPNGPLTTFPSLVTLLTPAESVPWYKIMLIGAV